MNLYDLIIIGTGPAGCAAGVYAARYRLNVLVIGEVAGGTMTEAHLVENWPGINSITGEALSENFINHLKYFKVPIIQTSVKGIIKHDNGFTVTTSDNQQQESKAIIIAAGTKKRVLNIPGEVEFKGKGVSYCATCDAFFFNKKTVAVVGGGDSAGTAALLLADHADKVYLIYRQTELRCEEITKERLKQNQKIELIYSTNLTKISGTDKVETISLDQQFNNSNELKVDGVFIEIGATPSADLARNIGVELDKADRIKINQDCSTNVPGVFAAGDITVGLFDLKQIVTAAASGAVAATTANKFVKTKK